MTPDTNHDNEINIYCDWLTDDGQEQLANDIRFEEMINHWYLEGALRWQRHDVGFVRNVGSSASKNWPGSMNISLYPTVGGIPCNNGIGGNTV